MDDIRKLNILVDLAQELGVTMRSVPPFGDSNAHPGGSFVRLKGKEILFLDTSAPTGDQIGVVVTALKDHPELTDRFLPPDIRELLDD
ncbi:MAG: hypothetical protein KAR11_07540 [Phycisphaerae bacterium]|nr:hypothetical protein [Phycisphaerae bacterium]